MRVKTLLTAIGLLLVTCASAQDPFFAHFFNNRALFNPALTGETGALSLRALYKSQWHLGGQIPYRTMAVTLEESMPCSWFDWGLNAVQDVEGDGRLSTFSGGFMLAGTPTLETRQAIHNLRIGAGINWAQRRIDFSRLTFSDQLDPKYGFFDVNGNPNPTAFVPPDFSGSFWYFMPSVGVAYKALFNKTNRHLGVFSMGYSIHNLFGLGDADVFGHQESVLRIGTTAAPRHTAFAEWEFVPYYSSQAYLSVRPTVFWQQQGGLTYAEVGVRVGLSRLLAAGAYYHFGRRPPSGVNTNWMSFNFETSVLVATGNRNTSRFDLGLSFSPNTSGLQNTVGVGSIVEVSVAMHFATSPGCKLMGREDDVSYGKLPCPTAAQSRRSKLYENIWYGKK
jgi:type IX secretion system PorP/SprF family membrane protein